MGKWREMTSDKAVGAPGRSKMWRDTADDGTGRERSMEDAGRNDASRADKTVSGTGSEDSWNDNGDRTSGGSVGGGYARPNDSGRGGKDGPGFPSRPWGRD